ncbi:hypothetical protein OG863_03525 [Streptomyces decoyicus]|uniref:Uncharacterized protein n=1 Tax=Streptomyces decoyicus TaxID=249567 RepID=A0ABZ1FA22_9ACTN|nr:hypothetical protein OG863_03525 [Streptomyces decoyicus]
MSGLKLFNTKGGVTEVAPRLAEVEADMQGLIEAHMEMMLGVRFLASEYNTGPVHGGRIDSLGIDENGARSSWSTSAAWTQTCRLNTGGVSAGQCPCGEGFVESAMEASRDLSALSVPLVGELAAMDDPYRLIDPAGQLVEAAGAFLRDLQGAGRSAATARSYSRRA